MNKDNEVIYVDVDELFKKENVESKTSAKTNSKMTKQKTSKIKELKTASKNLRRNILKITR